MTEHTKKKRITVMLAKPNPLFEQWLAEWKEEARQKGSKMERTFTYALTNLRKCTIPLTSGHECKIIKGFGDKLCKMLDEKLSLYNKAKENTPNTTVSNIPSVLPQKPRDIQSSSKEYVSKQSCSNEYIPKHRSGGYAILLALHSSWPDLLTKEEIIHLGKQFSNYSFIKPDPGSYYTAWSSMKTLLGKELVIKKGKPAKYSLSESGHNIAKKLVEDNSDTSRNKQNGLKLVTTETTPSILSNNKIDNLPEKNEKYLNIHTVPDNPQTQALQNQNNDIIDLIDDDDDIIQNALLSNEVDDYTNELRISSYQIELPSIQTLKNIIPQESSTSNKNNPHFDQFPSYSSQNIEQSKNLKSVRKCVSADSLANKKLVNKLSSTRLKKCTSSSSVTKISEEEECFIFESNSFDIILYVDTQETTGSNNDIQDDPLLSKLQNNSVQYEIKHLNVGDYVWICRNRQSKKELVLPYIIERKRLDDFASSIKDGRYHEQKFRLKKCGIQNITYLIEKINKQISLPISTLHQAAANTAIQDGFNVKFTTNIGHTATYLASFSKLLSRNFKDKTLVSCPKENISKVNITDDLISLMVFKEFNKASSKNKPMRVSDLFIKMLIQIRGMSVEKACAIVGIYPSPRILKDNYNRNTPAQGEKLLAKITFGKYNKCIGPVLSKIVFDLFTMEKF